ncbi:MAG TPA: L,D-transpeptidase [Jatrophihabitantaceae bacterium]|jgi:lipoprotein-anchoring transpeptidase ErfK/SrfK|nr:L,D-transpeptidase [Jatrophihabitantaceae bacterium]
MHGFVARHGWRVSALPVLIVLTVVVVVQPATDRPHAASAAPTTARPATSQASSAAPPALGAMPKASTVRTIGDSTACQGNKIRALALVSLREQHVWLCERQRQVYSTPVTTGAVALGLGTPIGSWQVVGKETSRYLSGPGYREYVHYWVPFWGPYGFHDSTWQKMAYGSSGYRQHGSHGCVHMPMTAMKWFYEWARVGTTTVIVVA